MAKKRGRKSREEMVDHIVTIECRGDKKIEVDYDGKQFIVTDTRGHTGYFHSVHGLFEHLIKDKITQKTHEDISSIHRSMSNAIKDLEEAATKISKISGVK